MKSSFLSALSLYWGEPSYPMRLESLARKVGDEVPDCVGRLNRWKNEMTALWIDLAHATRRPTAAGRGMKRSGNVRPDQIAPMEATDPPAAGGRGSRHRAG
jgi:hypothetical protein